jgi:hypothetical protein
VRPIYGAWVGIFRGLCLDLVPLIGLRDMHFLCIGIGVNKQHDKKHTFSYHQKISK